MANRLDQWALPSRPIKVPATSAREMFEVAVAALCRFSLRPLTTRTCLAFRDTLIVSLLLACPIRLRNLTMMELGRHLQRVAGTWHIVFDDRETKTGQALHLLAPSAIAPHIEFYISSVRSRIPNPHKTQRVWMASKGKPMAQETIYGRVRRTSDVLFGTPLNPHAFRSIAATALAEASPEDALYARPLLGHRQPATTEHFYVRASQIRSSRIISQALIEARDTLPRVSED